LIELDLKGMVGKGERSDAVVEAMKKHGCVYIAAIGGAEALASKRIKSYTIFAYEDPGPEALSFVEVENFPVTVVIDCKGNNYYVN